MRVRWSPLEDQTIREMFATSSYGDIARKLSRHKATIRRRARALGLFRDLRTLRKLHKQSHQHQVGWQDYIPTPQMLAPDAKPIASDDQERWWRRQREADRKFQELLKGS